MADHRIRRSGPCRSRKNTARPEACTHREGMQMWTEDSGQRLFQACEALSRKRITRKLRLLLQRNSFTSMRKGEADCGTRSWLAGCPHFAAVRQHEIAGDGKAEARTPRIRSFVEALECTLEFLLRHSHPAIVHLNQD